MKDYYLGERSKGGSGLGRTRRVLISAGALLTLIILAGLGYTWYNGQQAPGQAKQPVSTELQAKQIVPRLPNRNAQESAAVETLTSPVAPGDNAMINVKTNPTSTCKIVVAYNNVAEADSGLMPKKADNFGTVGWAWTVPKNAPLGSWPVTVTCQYYEKSAVVTQDLRVEEGNSATSAN